jgi:ABC-type thiamin/hydroxymethylpyrimidine transport system permease subunit
VIWLLFPYSRLPYVGAATLAEIFAWLVEAAYFAWQFGVRRALLASLIANGASFVLGMISRKLFGLP